MTLEARDLSLGYDGPPVVEDLNLRIPPGQVTAVVGANACGKSTLLRGLARLLRPRSGAVYLDERPLGQIPTRQVARRLSILPQRPEAPEGLSVRELVAQGRYPHRGLLGRWTEDDERAVRWALEATGMEPFASRPLDELSGGQAQHAWIAMVLAQETDILLLDEPTTFLDVAHQIQVLDILHDLNEEEGRTVVMVLHDLNQAARYAHHLVAMKEGRIVASGPPDRLVTAELVVEVFGLPCRVLADPVSGRPLCIPLSRRGRT